MTTHSQTFFARALMVLLLIGVPPTLAATAAADSDAAGTVAGADADATRPNILFIFTDDQAPDALGLFNPEIKTPHLDQLAARGTTFTNAYNQGSWTPAVCVASRTMLLTGAQMWRAASYSTKRNNRDRNTPREMPEYTVPTRETPEYWPVFMRRAGYEAYFTGKYHVDGRPGDSFDVVRNVRGGMPRQTAVRYNRPFIEGEPDTWRPYDTQFGGFWGGGTHWTEVTANDAIAFLEHAKDREPPFFMYIAFNAPHDPRQSPKEFVDMYPLENVSVPPNFKPVYPWREEIGSGETLRDERLAPFPRTEYPIRVNRQEYYAITTHLDYHVGRILDKLERTGQADNTIVIFTSDHGLAVGQHGFVGKQNMYEHSMKVPLIIAGPGIPAGRKVDTPVYLQDIMPMALDLAGAEYPEHVNYRSLLPLARGDDANYEPYPAIYGAYMGTQRMIRRGDFKMIIYTTPQIVRLYNLSEDPWETNDLATDPSYRSIMDDLFVAFQQLQQTVEDPLDVTPFYEAFFANRD
jgi:arylsulfatase A-like enzyme